MNLVRHQLGFSQTESRFPTKGTCLSIYSSAVNAEMPLEAVLQGHFPWLLRLGGRSCGSCSVGMWKPSRPKACSITTTCCSTGRRWSATWRWQDHIGVRFDHIPVDEYQDTNRLQSSILLALKPGGAGLTVVGDDAQSIYAFRAATVRNILDFPGQFSPSAAIITLDRNYRSTQQILAAANGVIGLAAERFTKNLWTDRRSTELPALVSVRDEADQARYVVERVLENREGGTELKQQAVLFRTSSHSGPTEIELTRRNIPFVKFGGLKFLDTAHVKDLLALLRFVENPRDWVAGFRILQLLPGVGPRSGAESAGLHGQPGRSDRGARGRCRPAPLGRRVDGPRDDASAATLRQGGLAGRDRLRAPLVHAPSRADARGSGGSAGGSAATRANRGRLSIAIALSDRPHSGSPRRH